MTTTNDTTRPMDFVYGGRRWVTQDHSIRHVVVPVDENRNLEREMYFKHSKDWRRMSVGSVYRGAEFSAQQAKGLHIAKVVEFEWQEKAKCIEWEALDQQAATHQASHKLENDAKRRSFIDEELSGLREVYNGFSKRGDWAGIEALERAVLLSLRKRKVTK